MPSDPELSFNAYLLGKWQFYCNLIPPGCCLVIYYPVINSIPPQGNRANSLLYRFQGLSNSQECRDAGTIWISQSYDYIALEFCDSNVLAIPKQCCVTPLNLDLYVHYSFKFPASYDCTILMVHTLCCHSFSSSIKLLSIWWLKGFHS